MFGNPHGLVDISQMHYICHEHMSEHWQELTAIRYGLGGREEKIVLAVYRSREEALSELGRIKGLVTQGPIVCSARPHAQGPDPNPER